MKRKIFQYGVVYWLAILINAIIAFFYLNYCYSILISSHINSKDILPLALIVLIGGFSPVALFFLIKRHRLAVLTQSILLLLIVINILGALLMDVFFFKSDYVLSYGMYFLLFGLWFIIVRKYRFKGSKVDLQIESIGKHKD